MLLHHKYLIILVSIKEIYKELKFRLLVGIDQNVIVALIYLLVITMRRYHRKTFYNFGLIFQNYKGKLLKLYATEKYLIPMYRCPSKTFMTLTVEQEIENWIYGIRFSIRVMCFKRFNEHISFSVLLQMPVMDDSNHRLSKSNAYHYKDFII